MPRCCLSSITLLPGGRCSIDEALAHLDSHHCRDLIPLLLPFNCTMVASVAAMQSHSPSHFKPAGLSSSTTTTTTTMTKKQQQQQQQQQQSRVRQRSNEERHHSNTDNMVTRASLEDDIRRMTENFEDEGAIEHTTSD